MSKSVSNTRFYIYVIAMIPFIFLLIAGVILLKYHAGAPLESTVMGLDGDFWMLFHKISCLITVPFILLHLFVKTDWVKNLILFKLKGSFQTSNVILFVVFVLCSLTAIVAWLIFDGTNTANMLIGIHNKLGLVLVIMFGVHVWNYRKVIINHFKKLR